MKNGYKSLHHSFRFTPYELSEMCRMYANGQSFKEIGFHFNRNAATIESIILIYYIGIIPKKNQQKITIKMKMEE